MTKTKEHKWDRICPRVTFAKLAAAANHKRWSQVNKRIMRTIGNPAFR